MAPGAIAGAGLATNGDEAAVAHVDVMFRISRPLVSTEMSMVGRELDERQRVGSPTTRGDDELAGDVLAGPLWLFLGSASALVKEGGA